MLDWSQCWTGLFIDCRFVRGRLHFLLWTKRFMELIYFSNKCIKIRSNHCLFTGHFPCTDVSFFTDDYSTISTIQQLLYLVAMNTTAVQQPMVSILTCHLGIRGLAVNQSLKPHPKHSTYSSMGAWVSSGTLVGLTDFQLLYWEIQSPPTLIVIFLMHLGVEFYWGKDGAYL